MTVLGAVILNKPQCGKCSYGLWFLFFCIRVFVCRCSLEVRTEKPNNSSLLDSIKDAVARLTDAFKNSVDLIEIMLTV